MYRVDKGSETGGSSHRKDGQFTFVRIQYLLIRMRKVLRTKDPPPFFFLVSVRQARLLELTSATVLQIHP